jgi:hypothetical protein
MAASQRRFDRDFLLSPEKRNQIIELHEVEQFGRDSFGDKDAVALYGMKPSEWHGRGVRILCRTALEAVRDPLGDAFGQAVARRAAIAPADTTFGVVDPFAGSCNGLYSLLRHLPGTAGIGFEFEPTIFEMSSRNIAALNAPIRLFNGDYRTLVQAHRVPEDRRVIAFLAPPWADALGPDGLDLGRTKPPIADIIDDFERAYSKRPILYAVELHERLIQPPLDALCRRLDDPELVVFDIAGPTGRHGLLLGTRHWNQ